MALFDRIRAILVEPKSEWPKIAAEAATVQSITAGWVAILAAIPALGVSAGMGNLRLALGQYVIALVLTALVAVIVDQLAPSFGGRRDFVASLKLVAYGSTPAWLAGVFHALGLFGGVFVYLAWLYAWYLMFLGAPVLRRCAPARALPFTIVIAVCSIAIGVLLVFALSGAGFALRPGVR